MSRSDHLIVIYLDRNCLIDFILIKIKKISTFESFLLEIRFLNHIAIVKMTLAYSDYKIFYHFFFK